MEETMEETPVWTHGSRAAVKNAPLPSHVGSGDPSGKYFGEMLSEDEEKRVDEKGRKVVEGLTWGLASTGLYLTLFAPKNPRDFSSPYGEVLALTDRCYLWMDVGRGRVKTPVEGVGLCLELPSDLGSDALKAQYVSEWVIATVKEILAGFNESPWLPEGIQVCLAMKVDAAISKAGL
jgi:hypothetical protein